MSAKVSLPKYHYPIHAGENPVVGRAFFLLGHVGLVCGLYEMYQLGCCWAVLGMLLFGFFYEHFGGLGITAGSHRMWAHKSYRGNGLYRFIVMVFNCIAFQGEIYYWAKDHRAHHKWSDTRRDPHNAQRGFWYSHMGWLLLERDPKLIEGLREIPYKDLLDDWVIQFQLRWYMAIVLIVRFLIPTYCGFLCCGSVYTAFCVNACGFWCQSLHHTFLVNSAAHMKGWGYRPYERGMRPNENPLVIYAAVGEGHHNFHHVFPRDYATSELNWSETYNPTKRFIDVAARLGMIAYRLRNQYDDKLGKWKLNRVEGTAESK